MESVLHCALEEKHIHEVRDVSPNKLMMCISFPLPRGALSHQVRVSSPHALCGEEGSANLFHNLSRLGLSVPQPHRLGAPNVRTNQSTLDKNEGRKRVTEAARKTRCPQLKDPSQ